VSKPNAISKPAPTPVIYILTTSLVALPYSLHVPFQLSHITTSSFSLPLGVPLLPHTSPLNRQLTPSNRHPRPIDQYPNPRPNNRYIPSKTRNRAQEISKQYKYPVKLDQEADERPTHKNQEEASEEGGGAF